MNCTCGTDTITNGTQHVFTNCTCSDPDDGSLAPLTNGIQDISALLPLLGTEQCEEHVGSALTKGFLYAAATPLSIFGSLGLAKAGFKALAASISIPFFHIHGATLLAHAGFWGNGDNLPLIMIDKKEMLKLQRDEQSREAGESEGSGRSRRRSQGTQTKKQAPRFLAETRLQSLLTELHIEEQSFLPHARYTQWNLVMLITTFVMCSLSITPYIFLNLQANRLSVGLRWAFPIIRAVGGFLCATMTQLVIEIRLRTIVQERLCAGGNTYDREERDHWADLLLLPDPLPYHHLPLYPNRLLQRLARSLRSIILSVRIFQGELLFLLAYFLRPVQILLGLGIVGSISGYIGCFIVVQGSSTSTGPLSWLLLEFGLSIIRMVLWAINPDWDDASPFRLSFVLTKGPSLVTCSQSERTIAEDRSLPLVRADKFLRDTSQIIGFVERFNDPRFSLYYTLTPQDILYITVLDVAEQTGWSYVGGPSIRIFRVQSVTVDEHDHHKIQAKIVPENQDRPLEETVDRKIRLHHKSLMHQFHVWKYVREQKLLSSYRQPDEPVDGYETLYTRWTLLTRDTGSRRMDFQIPSIIREDRPPTQTPAPTHSQPQSNSMDQPRF